jgi:hypothetical protein
MSLIVCVTPLHHLFKRERRIYGLFRESLSDIRNVTCDTEDSNMADVIECDLRAMFFLR